MSVGAGCTLRGWGEGMTMILGGVCLQPPPGVFVWSIIEVLHLCAGQGSLLCDFY